MAQALLKPAVADFMDSIAADHLDLKFEQVEISASSAYRGRKLKDTNIRSELDIVVVAVRRQDGAMVFNPMADEELRAADLLIAIGRAESLSELAKTAKGHSK
ncbi:MAG: TrkA C-terminal domain-containing protein [Pyrinomonadaceae bacterium]